MAAPYAVWHGLAAIESSGDLQVLSSPDVTVTDLSSGSLATLYADRDGNTGKSNPFTAGANGDIEFYVQGGRYRIEATDSSSTATWENEGIGTASERDAITDGGDVIVSAGAAYDADAGSFVASSLTNGVVIERGSNSNGEYVRYADGTQICWINENDGFTADSSFQGSSGVNVSSTSNNDNADWSYPANFSDQPTVHCEALNGAATGDIVNLTSGGVDLLIYSIDGAQSSIPVVATATGRWK